MHLDGSGVVVIGNCLSTKPCVCTPRLSSGGLRAFTGAGRSASAKREAPANTAIRMVTALRIVDLVTFVTCCWAEPNMLCTTPPGGCSAISRSNSSAVSIMGPSSSLFVIVGCSKIRKQPNTKYHKSFILYIKASCFLSAIHRTKVKSWHRCTSAISQIHHLSS